MKLMVFWISFRQTFSFDSLFFVWPRNDNPY